MCSGSDHSRVEIPRVQNIRTDLSKNTNEGDGEGGYELRRKQSIIFADRLEHS